MTITPITVRPKEAAKMIGIGMTKLYELINSKEIPSFLVGRTRMIEVEELRRWIERQKEAA